MPLTAEPVAEMMQRLSMPIPECGCHAWLGKIGTGGYAYGLYRVGGKRFCRKAATIAFELAKGPRPEGMEIHHTCHSRWCVNPDHLILTTRSENSRQRRSYTLPTRRRTPEEKQLYLQQWRERNKDWMRRYAQENKDRINAQRRERRHRQQEVT